MPHVTACDTTLDELIFYLTLTNVTQHRNADILGKTRRRNCPHSGMWVQRFLINPAGPYMPNFLRFNEVYLFIVGAAFLCHGRGDSVSSQS